MDDELIMEKELDELRTQHSDIDTKITELEENPFQDQLLIHRLKREKLQLKDKIFQLEEALYPDIIA